MYISLITRSNAVGNHDVMSVTAIQYVYIVRYERSPVAIVRDKRFVVPNTLCTTKPSGGGVLKQTIASAILIKLLIKTTIVVFKRWTWI